MLENDRGRIILVEQVATILCRTSESEGNAVSGEVADLLAVLPRHGPAFDEALLIAGFLRF